MENGTERYIETVAYLGKLYDFINEHLFGGELVKPVITIQVDSRNKAYGWWSKQKVWKESKDDEGVHELNLCAQYLNRPIENIAETMIHEMCHQFASVHNLQDCSRSGIYHKYTVYEAKVVDDDGNEYSYKIKPARNSDKSYLEFFLTELSKRENGG